MTQKLNNRIEKINSLLCVGLDPEISKIPETFQREDYPQFAFNKWIIDETHEYVSSYKPNFAFYEALGIKGWESLKLTIQYIQKNVPDIFIIADAKRGDIGSTNAAYATAIFDELGCDAVTLHPYLGRDALQPFLDRKDKTSIFLIRTSNPKSGEFQQLTVDGVSLWQVILQHITQDWNANNNCMIVFGATHAEEIQTARTIAPHMTFLVPGVGAQGGDLTSILRFGKNNNGGLIINASRSIIFSENPKREAQILRDSINGLR